LPYYQYFHFHYDYAFRCHYDTSCLIHTCHCWYCWYWYYWLFTITLLRFRLHIDIFTILRHWFYLRHYYAVDARHIMISAGFHPPAAIIWLVRLFHWYSLHWFWLSLMIIYFDAALRLMLPLFTLRHWLLIILPLMMLWCRRHWVIAAFINSWLLMPLLSWPASTLRQLRHYTCRHYTSSAIAAIDIVGHWLVILVASHYINTISSASFSLIRHWLPIAGQPDWCHCHFHYHTPHNSHYHWVFAAAMIRHYAITALRHAGCHTLAGYAFAVIAFITLKILHTAITAIATQLSFMPWPLRPLAGACSSRRKPYWPAYRWCHWLSLPLTPPPLLAAIASPASWYHWLRYCRHTPMPHINSCCCLMPLIVLRH